MRALNLTLFLSLPILLGDCSPSTEKKEENKNEIEPSSVSNFGDDVSFLRQHTDIIVLEEPTSGGLVALSPALQGRVMTSSANGLSGVGYGWINKKLFMSGDTSEHINAFGGEERFWLGPEGGQYSIFFRKGDAFTLDNWFTPKFIDLVRFEVISKTNDQVVFNQSASLTNYSGFSFDIEVTRQIELLAWDEISKGLDVALNEEVRTVAYRSTNTLKNAGKVPWEKETGLLSIWMLGMFNPSPQTTVIIPFVNGDESKLGPIVNDEYFGRVPANRLKVKGDVVYFKGDGQHRSKIGLSPLRSKDVMGSYDAGSNTLTILKYNKPDSLTEYVNSKWEIQEDPYSGDVVNSYNDGAPEPGKEPLGPFYELESSSPAAALKPGGSLTHIQSTFHFEGDEKILDPIAQKLLGVSLEDIKAAFK